MKTRLTIAFWLYLIAMAMGVFFGVRHLLATQLPSYHIGAIGVEWGELDQNYQVLFLTLLRVLGSSQLGFGIAGLAIVLIPFRAKEAWANWVLLAMGLVTGVSTTYASLNLQLQTPTSTPWFAPSLSVLLALLAFAISTGVMQGDGARRAVSWRVEGAEGSYWLTRQAASRQFSEVSRHQPVSRYRPRVHSQNTPSSLRRKNLALSFP